MIKGRFIAFAMVIAMVACKPLAREESRGLQSEKQSVVNVVVKRAGEQTYLAVCPHAASCVNALLDKKNEPFYFAKPISVDELEPAKRNLVNRIWSATIIAGAATLAFFGGHSAYKIARNHNFSKVVHGNREIENLKKLTNELEDVLRERVFTETVSQGMDAIDSVLRERFLKMVDAREVKALDERAEILTKQAIETIDDLKKSVSDKNVIDNLDSLKRSVENNLLDTPRWVESFLDDVSKMRREEWQFMAMSAVGVPLLLHVSRLGAIDPTWNDRMPDLVDLFAHGKPITVNRSELTTLLAFVADKSNAKINKSVFNFFD